jgi:hypothetical protein
MSSYSALKLTVAAPSSSSYDGRDSLVDLPNRHPLRRKWHYLTTTARYRLDIGPLPVSLLAGANGMSSSVRGPRPPTGIRVVYGAGRPPA